MPMTKPRQFRLTDAELAEIDELAKLWGPVEPLTRTQVIREMLKRSRKAEQKGKRKNSQKSIRRGLTV